MRHQRRWAAFGAVVLLVTGGGCGLGRLDVAAAAEQAGFPVTIESCGTKVTFDERPQRVFVYTGMAAQLVVAAGGGDRIIAYSTDDRPSLGPAQSVVDEVQQFHINGEPPREVIIGTNPDVIIGYPLFDTTPEDLAAAGIKTAYINGFCEDAGISAEAGSSRFELIYRDIESYGRLFGTEEVATKAVADLRQRVAAVEQQFADTPERTAAVLAVYAGGMGTYGNESMPHEQLELLGLRNVFGDEGGRFKEISVEELIDRDPDVFILAIQTGGEEEARRLESSGQLANMKAIRNGDVVKVNSVSILDSSTWAFDGLEQMADQLEKLG